MLAQIHCYVTCFESFPVYIYLYTCNLYGVQVGLVVFNDYEDANSEMSEIRVWMPVHEKFSHSCHQQIIQNI